MTPEEEETFNKYQDHHFSYYFDRSEWGISIKAKSEEEAKARIKALQHAVYKGYGGYRVPYALSGLFGLWLQFREWLKGLYK